jgi:carbon-monoxide dehydrogenase small subunit
MYGYFNKLNIYDKLTIIELNVNGELRKVTVRPSDILLDVLREQLGLTGAKPGCKNGDCGTCTVLLDGMPVKSCLTLAIETVGHEILTVEGLKGQAKIQEAFVEYNAFQCGYCTSGFLMVCHALVNNKPNASEYEIEKWLESNICRCTSYQEIRKAINSVLNNY